MLLEKKEMLRFVRICNHYPDGRAPIDTNHFIRIQSTVFTYRSLCENCICENCIKNHIHVS